jgi:hypothetical protein
LNMECESYHPVDKTMVRPLGMELRGETNVAATVHVLDHSSYKTSFFSCGTTSMSTRIGFPDRMWTQGGQLPYDKVLTECAPYPLWSFLS